MSTNNLGKTTWSDDEPTFYASDAPTEIQMRINTLDNDLARKTRELNDARLDATNALRDIEEIKALQQGYRAILELAAPLAEK